MGFGGPLPSASLSLVDGQEQIIRGESFTARRIDAYWWAVDRVTGAKKDLYGIEGPSHMQTELELCLATVSDKDFDALNLACSRPGTEFHDHRIANLRTPNGYFAIWDDVLTVRKDGKKERIPLPDEAAFADACEQYFGFRPHGAWRGANTGSRQDRAPRPAAASAGSGGRKAAGTPREPLVNGARTGLIAFRIRFSP